MTRLNHRSRSSCRCDLFGQFNKTVLECTKTAGDQYAVTVEGSVTVDKGGVLISIAQFNNGQINIIGTIIPQSNNALGGILSDKGIKPGVSFAIGIQLVAVEPFIAVNFYSLLL